MIKGIRITITLSIMVGATFIYSLFQSSREQCELSVALLREAPATIDWIKKNSGPFRAPTVEEQFLAPVMEHTWVAARTVYFGLSNLHLSKADRKAFEALAQTPLSNSKLFLENYEKLLAVIPTNACNLDVEKSTYVQNIRALKRGADRALASQLSGMIQRN